MFIESHDFDKMRRSYNSDVRATTTTSSSTTDGLEVTRRLYRSISDIAKRLDEQKSHALTVTDIFTPTGETLRTKLRDYCERLIFKDPVSHIRKTEELLWRRGFYDVVSLAKKIRKGNVWSNAEKASLSAHLAVGVGYYHHLILRLQTECNLDLIGVIDFAYPYNDNNTSNIKSKNQPSKLQTEEVRQCAIRFIHRCLICLGDLARYKLDLDPNWDPLIATRYYKMAVAIDPNIGMSHNQLGTMAGNKNFGLDGVYHYMRSILCSESFDGAEGNLRRTIVLHSTSGKEKCLTHECIAKLLSLLQLWESEDTSPERVNQECESLLNTIENCLSLERTFPNKNLLKDVDDIETYLQKCKIDDSVYLNDDVIFKIMAICLMSISKLRNKDSCDIRGVIAFTLAVLSQLVNSAILRIQESLIDVSLANGEHDLNLQFSNFTGEIIKEEDGEIAVLKESSNTNESLNLSKQNENLTTNGNHTNGVKKPKDKSRSLLTKLRRRKRRNSSDSDNSDADNRTAVLSSSDEMNSDISETEEDALSKENPFSDDALSEDLSDEEEIEDKDSAIKSKITTDNQNSQQFSSEINVETADITENGDLNKNPKTLMSESAILNVEANSAFNECSASTNTISYVAQLKKPKYQKLILDVLTSESLLSSVKLCCDWLKCHPDILKNCASNLKTLLKRLTILFNLINIDPNLQNSEIPTEFLSRINNFEEKFTSVPLPEDVNMKGFKDLEQVHKTLDWKLLRRVKIDKRDQTILRNLKLIEFGKYLCSMECLGLSYDEDQKLFVIKNESEFINNIEKDGKKSDDHPRGKLMRHMGRLWLKAEVRALESRLRSRLMSPYLVPDHEALAKHTPALKRLVFAKKFIIVIPSVVVSALDEVKRTSGQAREATRWLEAQLRRGSRFLRAQRPHERLPIPLIKGPRPKDKEAWLYFQIIECCHYLTQQSNVEVTSDSEIPIVTLLTGCSAEDQKSLTVSPEGLAKSAGVNIEHIEAFHTKWKASSKSHG